MGIKFTSSAGGAKKSSLEQYTYKNGTSIQTGSSSANPVQRSLQSRLDDIVNVRSFGANGDGTDQTLALRRAIDQLFLPWSSATDADSLRKRITILQTKNNLLSYQGSKSRRKKKVNKLFL